MIPRTGPDRDILALALPAAGSALVQLLYRAVDMAWVKGLEPGEESVAALAVSTNTVWLFGGFSALVSMGLGAVVARYVGAGRLDGARYAASQGLRWAGAMGLVSAVLGWFGAPLVFEIAQAAPGVRDAGIPYTRIYWMGGVTILLQQAGDAVFRAHGNTRLPFLAAAMALALNAIIDPILIFGWGPIPAMGVPGAAWATVISAGLGAGVLLLALRRRAFVGRDRPSDEHLRLSDTTLLGRPGRAGLDLALFRRVARVGLPVTLASLFFNAIYLVLQRIAERAAGPAGQAGLGIGWTGEGIAFVLCLGWSAAASSLVGRSMGAGRIADAERYAWRAATQCGLLCAAWGVVLWLFAEPIASAFTNDPASLDLGAAYFRIVAICLAPQAVEIVLEGAFGGAGQTLPAMVISMVFTALRIPLAYGAAIGLGMGASGIWWTICITAILRGAVCAFWFQRGTWKTRSV
jgi:putative MATE family efflux protein